MTAQPKLQAGEPTPAQQSAMYESIVRRMTNKLTIHYQQLCEETNNTWPNYRADCRQAALTEIEDMYSRKEK